MVLNYIYIIYFQTNPDGDCLFSSILQQIQHDPKYTSNMLRRQTALYLMKNVDFFFKYLEPILQEDDMSFTSYVKNIFDGNIWGETLLASVIGRMFKLKITVTNTTYEKDIKLFHKAKTPDIVIIANGGEWFSENPATHFSATGKNNLKKKLTLSV